MGGVREDIVAPMPTARVVGPWAGTPEGAAVLKQYAPEIAHRVMGLRQHYYTGTQPMVRKTIDTPAYQMEYVMHEGKELITLLPRASKVTAEEPPSGPCRFILIEHTYSYNTVQLFQLSPPYELASGDTVSSEIDAHRLFSRHEILSGALKDKYVGTGLGTTTGPREVPNWQDYRGTPEGYPNTSPLLYETKEEWPPIWRHWRVAPGVQTLPTKASRHARVPSFSNLPSVNDDPAGVFDAQQTVNVITIIDVQKYRDIVGDVVSLRCSGFWGTLMVTWGAPIALWYGISKFRYDFAANFVRFAEPHTVQTAISRVWMSGEEEFTALGDNIDRLMKLLDEAPFVDSELQSSEEYQRSLGISLATTAFTRSVAATQSQRVLTYPDENGLSMENQVGSPPTVLPWGDVFGTLTYNCRTGAWGFSPGDSEPVDLS